jgi:hypothetical protein
MASGGTVPRAVAIAAAGVLIAVGVLVLRGSGAAASCPVTIPSGEPPPDSPSASGWHGSGKVRVGLPEDGRLAVTDEHPPPPGTTPGTVHDDGSISSKFLWWLARSAGRRVRIAGRLDGGSETHVLARGRRRLPDYWPSRPRFPSAGCWRVTGRAGRSRLRFTIDVSAAR